MENYPIIRLLHRHGTWLAALVAVCPPLGALAMFLAGGLPWPVLPMGVVMGAVVYVLARSYVELIHIITETLMPR